MQETLFYGIHAIQEAMKEGKLLSKVLIQKDIRNERIAGLVADLRKELVPVQFVPKEKLNRLANNNHQGIVAISSPVAYQTIEEVLPKLFESGRTPLIAILDSITDVRNVGAIARSAECFGIDAIVVPAKGAAMINSEAVKASAGALHKIPICREIHFSSAIKYMKESGLRLIACTEKAEQNIDAIDFSLPTAIVLGSEGEGINPGLIALCDEQARIPMTGEILSLNVSVSAGIIFYEALNFRVRNGIGM